MSGFSAPHRALLVRAPPPTLILPRALRADPLSPEGGSAQRRAKQKRPAGSGAGVVRPTRFKHDGWSRQDRFCLGRRSGLGRISAPLHASRRPAAQDAVARV